LKHIAIIRLSSLGDIVHALPALQALRRRFPDAHISWIAEPAGAALLGCFPGIDRIVVFDLRSRRGLPAKLLFLFRFLRDWRRQFDLVLDFQGLLKSAVLAFLLGGERWGFCRRNAREPLAALFYTRRASPFPETRHVIHKNLHLLSLAGIGGTEVEYPLREWRPSERLASFLQRSGLPDGGLAVLNVGGGWPSKLLSAGQWLEIARGLKKDYRPVMLWGNEREREIAESVARQSGVQLAPFMDFCDLICFIARARFLISGDTLALHLADMTRTPAVGVFGPTSPARNGPLFPGSVAVRRELACGFCYKRRCDKMDCLQGIVTEDIIKAARRIDEQRDRNPD
jgi:heptosyltransferase-1